MLRTIIRLIVTAILLFIVGVVIGRAEAKDRVPLQVIQGEAGTCPIEAKYAVAHLWHRNQRMYGWDAGIDSDTYIVWRTYKGIPDLHPESQNIFSSDDLSDPRVLDIIRERNRPPRAVFRCSGGSALFLY